MKKGISLIVLVITIIIMVIIAGAIILSLNNTQLINQSSSAVKTANLAEANSILAVEYAEILARYYATNPQFEYVTTAVDMNALNTTMTTETSGKYGVTYKTAENKTDGYVVVELKTAATAY